MADQAASILAFDESGLRLQGQDKDAENVPLENIIALIPPSLGESGKPSWSLHYVTKRTDARTSNEQTTDEVRCQQLIDPPPALIKEFDPSEKSWFKTWQQAKDKTNVTTIISTASGTGQAEPIYRNIVKPLVQNLNLFANPSEHYTESETSVATITRDTILPTATAGHPQLILLLSGDGGLLDIINTLLQSPPSPNFRRPHLALIPCGTGNALANSAGLKHDSTFGLRNLLHGIPTPIPLFRASFSPGARVITDYGASIKPLETAANGAPVAHGAVVCSWGLHAALVADSDTAEYRKHGAARFQMAAKESLFPSDGSLPHAYRGKVSLRRAGGGGWEALPREEHGYVLASLVSNLEAGFTVSPASRPLDGVLRVVHFGRVSGEVAMGIMEKAYDGGRHVEDERVGYEAVEGLRVEFDETERRWRRVCVDGKIVVVEEGGWVEMETGVEGVVELVCSGRT